MYYIVRSSREKVKYDFRRNFMDDKKILENLIRILPYWHYKVERPIKQTQKHNPISYEAYYGLFTLYRKGPLRMSVLAQTLHLSKQQATQIIDRLFQHGLVERANNLNDRRVILIKISASGVKFLKENALHADHVQQCIHLNLSDAEKEELLNATSILLNLLPKLS